MRHLIKTAGVAVKVTLANTIKTISIAAAVMLANATVALAAVGTGGNTGGNTGNTAGGDQLGSNLGNLISSWGKDLLLAVAGFMGIAALLKRDMKHAAEITAIAVVIGGFLLAPNSVQHSITAIWQSL